MENPENDFIPQFRCRVGTLEEVARDEGTETSSVEEFDALFDSRSPGGIYLPLVAGIFQDLSQKEFLTASEEAEKRKIEKRINALSQIHVHSISSNQERLHPNLICLIYDQDIMIRRLVSDFLDERDPLGRVKVIQYTNVPNFGDKKVIEVYSKASEALEDYHSNPDSKARKNLNKHKAVLEKTQKEYGLIRHEAILYRCIKSHLEQDREE
jgi:hypothetical protein